MSDTDPTIEEPDDDTEVEDEEGDEVLTDTIAERDDIITGIASDD